MVEVGPKMSNYKANPKEAESNKRRLKELIKMPQNHICADCPNRCAHARTPGEGGRAGGTRARALALTDAAPTA